MADFVRQRQRWAAGTLQSLRMKEGPLGGTGLSAGQRLAYLEGVVHWFNNLPRLVLLLMPLSYGLLGVVPIRLTAEAAVALLLPLWATLLLSLGWLNRGSRAAFLSELTGWVLTVPLTITVISQIWGRLGGFRVTPKHQRRDRGSWSLPLVAPLLLLILLNGFNLVGLLSPTTPLSGLALQGQPVGLVWALLNLLSLLVALRACWDPAAIDPVPWQAMALEARLEDDGGHSHPCRITAISERGAELTVADAARSGARSAGTRLGRAEQPPTARPAALAVHATGMLGRPAGSGRMAGASGPDHTDSPTVARAYHLRPQPDPADLQANSSVRVPLIAWVANSSATSRLRATCTRRIRGLAAISACSAVESRKQPVSSTPPQKWDCQKRACSGESARRSTSG
jgi:hypothetical protein